MITLNCSEHSPCLLVALIVYGPASDLLDFGTERLTLSSVCSTVACIGWEKRQQFLRCLYDLVLDYYEMIWFHCVTGF